MKRSVWIALLFVAAAPAIAQQALYDPEDFVDPRQTGGRPVFISRIVLGAGSDLTDSFRPLGDQIAFVHLSNSFYWRSFQFDYKHGEQRAEGGEEAVWDYPRRQPPTNVTPNGESPQPSERARMRAATPSSKDTVHMAFYWPIPAGGGIPVMLRSRATFTTHEVTAIKSSFGDDEAPLSARERTYAIETDTWFRIAGRDVYGSLSVSGTKLSGTDVEDRDERSITYTNRFPAFSFDRARVVVRPTLTVGGISNRDSSGVNLVSPAIEIVRPFVKSGANLHLIYSPQWSKGAGDWETKHQVAIVIDRALFVKVF